MVKNTAFLNTTNTFVFNCLNVNPKTAGGVSLTPPPPPPLGVF